MKLIFSVLFSIISVSAVFGQTYAGSIAVEQGVLAMEVEINANKKEVSIRLEGPADVWFAVGFGAAVMRGSYALVVSQKGIEERLLQGRNEGEFLPKSIKVLSDTMVLGKRKITLLRALQGANESYFDFPSSAAGIPIIYAIGKSEKSNKKHGSRGQAQLILQQR